MLNTRSLLGTNLLIKAEIGKAFNLDTICISDFVRIPRGSKKVLDIGTGNGAIMLYLSQKFKGKIYGVELQEKRFKIAQENIKLNNLEDRLEVINTDIKTFNDQDKFDCIVSNPPFFKVNDDTKRSIDDEMEIAKHELFLNLDELISSVRRNLKHGGLFFMIHKADRLDEIMATLLKYEFFIKKIRFIHPRIDKMANQVMIESRFKGSNFLTIEPPLIQYDGNELSSEMKSIHEGRTYNASTKKL